MGGIPCLALIVLCATAFAAGADRFGVTQLAPTIPGGREWFADWSRARAVPAYSTDPRDPQFVNEDQPLQIADGVASIRAGLTRLKVITPKTAGSPPLPEWRNVEMTIYARRGALRKKLDYQAFYLSARSGEKHNSDVPCDGTSYHSTARFDGQCGFKKEIWHAGGYTDLRPHPAPRPWSTVPEGEWIGLKFLCRNCDGGRHVSLQLYLDARADDVWELVSEYRDAGGWNGEQPGCERPQDFLITVPRPAVYFRTDEVDVQLKAFSVREIAPLP
jgi:hypothetical protein